MKNLFAAFGMGVVLFASCNAPNQKIEQDHSESKKVTDTISHSSSAVSSEHHNAKTEEGYALPTLNEGKGQSPINILTLDAEKNNKKATSVKFDAEIVAVENLGHTIQLDFKEGSKVEVNGKSYTTKQFHFHTPSEHLIDGMTFPMELHIVNMLKDSSSNQPTYLVVGILFKMGRENKFLQEFINSIPSEEGEKRVMQAGAVHFKDLLSQIPKDQEDKYYTYIGSLTTNPFTEPVSWMVRKYILEASPEQILTIEKWEGNNARHVHAVFDRKVVSL